MKRASNQAGASTGLSALFLLVYGSANWISGLRAHVGSVHFAWEGYIPFIPAMILPYLSIDLFFVAAPFLTRSDRELKTLCKRIATAIIFAGACFILFPLRFAFDRPAAPGLLGWLFNHFRMLDAPFNQCPSLHIALGLILADFYFRHSRGLVRWMTMAWFFLIGLSPLLTYQHHVIDVIGGFVLGLLCLHFIADEPIRRPFSPNIRVGYYYLSGSLVVASLALLSMPLSLILFWPALSLLLIAAGYLFLGPGLFRKHDGKLPWTTKLLFAPVLLGQRLSIVHYARLCRPFDQLTDRVWIGRRLSLAESRKLLELGAFAVLDLTAEFEECPNLLGTHYLQIPILDLTAPTSAQIESALQFIEEHRRERNVYIHCKVGYSRTGAIAGAYLISSGEADSPVEAIERLRSARPPIILRPEAVQAIHNFAASQFSNTV